MARPNVHNDNALYRDVNKVSYIQLNSDADNLMTNDQIMTSFHISPSVYLGTTHVIAVYRSRKSDNHFYGT